MMQDSKIQSRVKRERSNTKAYSKYIVSSLNYNKNAVQRDYCTYDFVEEVALSKHFKSLTNLSKTS